jgi:hypothetical protein
MGSGEFKSGNASTNKHPKFAQLTLDFTFKKAFAEEECKELLISLIEAFLGKYLPARIKDVQLRPTERKNKNSKRRAADEPDSEFEIESRNVVRHIGLSDLDNPKRRYNHIHLALVILARFNKTSEHCKTIMDKWLYLFRNLHKLKKLPKKQIMAMR